MLSKDLQCCSILHGIENTSGILEELITQAALIAEQYLHIQIFLKETIQMHLLLKGKRFLALQIIRPGIAASM
jgi:hypothetical protein